MLFGAMSPLDRHHLFALLFDDNPHDQVVYMLILWLKVCLGSGVDIPCVLDSSV
jgi:hypothetical protein